MSKKRKLRKLEKELTGENGDGLDLNIKTLHQINDGELEPSELTEEARKKLEGIAKRAKEADE